MQQRTYKLNRSYTVYRKRNTCHIYGMVSPLPHNPVHLPAASGVLRLLMKCTLVVKTSDLYISIKFAFYFIIRFSIQLYSCLIR